MILADILARFMRCVPSWTIEQEGEGRWRCDTPQVTRYGVDPVDAVAAVIDEHVRRSYAQGWKK